MSEIQMLRFPDGHVEYRSSPDELAVGMVIHARGRTWRVRSRTGTTAIVEAIESEPAGGPAVIPNPLGDETPLSLEILAAV